MILQHKRLTLPLYFLVFVLLACTPPVVTIEPFQNENVPEALGEPVLINLNSYYILYMHPVPPFKSGGRVFVPLNHFAILLAVEPTFTYGVDVEKAPLSVLLSRGTTEVAINNESLVSITNTQTGQTTTYSEKMIWREVEDSLYGVYVPLDIFKDAFGVDVDSDETGTIYVIDSELNNNPSINTFTNFLAENTYFYEVQTTPIILPTKVSLEDTKDEEALWKIVLEIKVPEGASVATKDISVGFAASYEGCCVYFEGDDQFESYTCQDSTANKNLVCIDYFPQNDEVIRDAPLRYIFSQIGIRIE